MIRCAEGRRPLHTIVHAFDQIALRFVLEIVVEQLLGKALKSLRVRKCTYQGALLDKSFRVKSRRLKSSSLSKIRATNTSPRT